MVALDRIAAALDARLAVTADERADDTTGVWRSATGRIQHLGLALEPDAVPTAWLCGESGAVDALLLHRPWGVDDLSLPEGAGVLACHRPFDAALTTGYHPALARALGLGEIEPFEEKDGRPLGMVGAFATPLASDEALRRLVEVLGGLKDVHPPTQPVRGVAVVRAMDERLVGEAHRCGAQLYVTGQMRRPGLDAVARTGIGVAAVGHRRSERFGLRVLAGLLRRRFAALGVRVTGGGRAPRAYSSVAVHRAAGSDSLEASRFIEQRPSIHFPPSVSSRVDAAAPTTSRSPAALAEALRRPGTVLLDTGRADADTDTDRALLFSEPQRTLLARRRAEVPGVLAAVKEATRAGQFVAGFVGYEAGYAFEPALFPEGQQDDDAPLAWLGVYDAPRVLSPAAVADALAQDAGPLPAVEDLRFDIARAAYRETIAEVKAAIRAGDVYQINLTAPVRFRFEGEPLALYRRMRRRQPVPYGAFLNLGDGRRVLSASPELFFRRDGARVWTRPMKGTVRRGASPEEDQRLRRALAADEKNRAENVMIVDLLRNDLSVCCEPDSVRVPELFSVEPYETVSQMTSTVEGRLKPDTGYADLFRALFPCGSVTGAPKLRAMRRIRRLEKEPRGVYCGAVGFAGPQEAAFNVAIRTVELAGAEGRMGIGSGVVWDSDPDTEYEECLLKAAFLNS